MDRSNREKSVIVPDRALSPYDALKLWEGNINKSSLSKPFENTDFKNDEIVQNIRFQLNTR